MDVKHFTCRSKIIRRFILAGINFILLICICPGPVDAQSVTASDLISLINGMRSANGLGALSVDYNLMACAQSTAETMAASHMTWHIGNVSGRASSFGYNNYNTCFATENFMMGSAGTTIGQIQASWSDATHMIPATSSSYCHIGAGVATGSDGMVYYVVQAAYPAGKAGCGYAASSGNAGAANGTGGAPMIIKSVVTATPDENGYIFHKVQEGQTLWAISDAYKVTVKDLQAWNNMNDSTALSLGQQLYIPSKNEAGSTPTPNIELTVFPTADAQGRFRHVVREGDTLWSISELWHVPLNSIYQANGMSADTSIGLGWEISIPVTATASPTPTETPTVTPVPSDTPLPTPTEHEADPETQTEQESGREQEHLLHLPGTSAKIYILACVFLSILAGGAVFGISKIWRKK